MATPRSLIISIAAATAHGLTGCSCGHPRNSHFDHGTNPCAHCTCKSFVLVARVCRLSRAKP